MILRTTGRTLVDGTWTPVKITLTGTDITVQGYTATEATGYLTVSGVVRNLIVDSELMTATMDGENAETLVTWRDYGLYVGVGETFFEVEGAENVTIEYTNRWY